MLGILAALVFGVLLLPARHGDSTGSSPVVPQQRNDSTCTMALTTTLQPNPQSICDPVDITTTFAAACTACPEGLNVVFIQDDTPYPEWQKQVSLQALTELQRFERQGNPVSVGVIHYNGQGPRVALNPTMNVGAARGALVSFRVAHDPRAKFMQAAQRGVAMIRQGRRLHGGEVNPACEFVIFFVYTKIYMADMGEEMIQAGRTILRVVPNLYVGCPHQHPEECTIWEPQVPKSQRFYTEDPEPSKLLGMVKQGLRDIEDEGLVRIITLSTDQWIPNDLELIPGSYSHEPDAIEVDGDRTKLTWDWHGPRLTDPVTLTYSAQPVVPGEWRSELVNSWRDSMNQSGEVGALSEPLEVYDEICQTPTPSMTPKPTPTWTPTSTPLPTETPIDTATPEPPTATPRPSPIYLPLTIKERCVPDEVHADVVLAIDVSTSMNRLTRAGRTKLSATQDAAKQFVSMMDLASRTGAEPGQGHDQVGLVGFNRTAWIQVPLGADIKQVHAGIDALPDRSAEHTRLDLALGVGARAILEGPRRAGNTPVLVLLTDGLPNQVPYAEDGTVETTVLRAADAAKAAGITVYTIAIGEPGDTNSQLLIGCASGEDRYYYTPDPEDLAQIYAAIAHSIDCPSSRFWGQH
ncbi:MAG: vWA domain-containing protein [Anaerolineae bacterium]